MQHMAVHYSHCYDKNTNTKKRYSDQTVDFHVFELLVEIEFWISDHVRKRLQGNSDQLKMFLCLYAQGIITDVLLSDVVNIDLWDIFFRIIYKVTRCGLEAISKKSLLFQTLRWSSFCSHV